MIIIVFGLPGSGKSYFASRLAEKLNAQYVNTDQVRLDLFPERHYSDAEKMTVYESMLTAMSDAIRNNRPIVLDGTFYKSELRDKFEESATKLNKNIIYIEITAPENVIQDRLKQTRKYSEANFDVYLKLKEMAEPLLKDHLILDSSEGSIDSMLRDAIHYINTFY